MAWSNYRTPMRIHQSPPPSFSTFFPNALPIFYSSPPQVFLSRLNVAIFIRIFLRNIYKYTLNTYNIFLFKGKFFEIWKTLSGGLIFLLQPTPADLFICSLPKHALHLYQQNYFTISAPRIHEAFDVVSSVNAWLWLRAPSLLEWDLPWVKWDVSLLSPVGRSSINDVHLGRIS